MLLSLAAQRRVLFVGGKGGVGKTSVASAVALARTRAGARVLLVSTDPAHNLGHLWDRRVGDDPTRLVAAEHVGRLDGVEIDPDRTVKAHLAEVRATMLRLLPERLHGQADRHLELARSAPGTYESAVLDRLAECVELGLAEYDLVVVDTAPTGHTLRLLALPEQLTSWTESLLANRDRAERFGAAVRGLGGRDTDAQRDTDAELRRALLRRQRRFSVLRDVVTDGARTSFVIVLTAERLGVAESLEMHAQLLGLGVDVPAVVVNRRSPTSDGALLAARRGHEDDQMRLLTEALESARRDRVSSRHDRAAIGVIEVPLLGGELYGVEGVGALADALADRG